MAKITPVTNGLQGLDARNQINEALKSVEVDSSLGGDGNSGTPLTVQEAPWGGLTGTLSDQTDLQNALNAKQTLITSRVVVNSKSDFPIPSAGVITLADNTEYFLGQDIDLGTDRIVFGTDCAIDGNSSTFAKLTYTGTGVMFTAVDNDIEVRNIQCTCASGTLLSSSNTVGNEGTATVSLESISVTAADKLGTFTDSASLILTNSTFFANDGFSFTGSDFVGLGGQFFAVTLTSGSGTLFDLGTAVFNTILISNQQVTIPSGSTLLSGAAASANLSLFGLGVVSFVSQFGNGTALAGIDIKDDRWNFFGNSDIRNTNRDRLNNQVVINRLEDFPEPVGGVITLEDNTDYVIGDSNVDVGVNRFVVGVNCVITGSPGPSVLLSSTTGDLFTGTDVNLFTIRDCVVSASNATILNFTDSVSPRTSIISVNNSEIRLAAKLAEMEDIRGLVVDGTLINSSDQGIEMIGFNTAVRIRDSVFGTTSATSKAIDFGTSTQDVILLTENTFIGPSGSIGISGLVSSGNINSGNIARVSGSEFLGAITTLENITVDDIRWSFESNAAIADSNPDAMLTLNSNAAATPISAANTPVKVVGSWTTERLSQFSSDATGRVTYLGERPLTTPIDATLSVETAGFGTDSVTAYIALNGTIITNSGRTSRSYLWFFN